MPDEANIGWRERVRVVIFEADTPAGKAFDVALFVTIAVSVLVVMLESVPIVQEQWGRELRMAEWFFTGIFTVEYLLRLLTFPRPFRYAVSFFGWVDLLSILPTYLSYFLPGSESMIVIRALRLLRIFRVFKLGRFLGEANLILTALHASRIKVTVFLGTVAVVVVIVGSLMYLVEGEPAGFTSIPRSMYWAIVTMTTVGYGDIAPQTPLGQMIAALLMIIGYGIIAVPTGIVTSELLEAARLPTNTIHCPSCLSEGHRLGARYCRDCGERLTPDEDEAQERALSD